MLFNYGRKRSISVYIRLEYVIASLICHIRKIYPAVTAKQRNNTTFLGLV